MTIDIDTAIDELSIYLMEFNSLQAHVQDDCEDLPNSDPYMKKILLRIGCLERNIKFLEQSIIGDLLVVPMIRFYNPKATQDEA